MRDIAGELPFPVDHDGLRLVARIIEDFNFTRFHDEELHGAVANRDENFTIPEVLRSNRGAIRQLGNLFLIEDRKSDGMESVFSHYVYSCSANTFA